MNIVMQIMVLAMLWAALAIWRIRILARFFQLEGYQPRRFWNWLRADRTRLIPMRWRVGAVAGVLLAVLWVALAMDAWPVHLLVWAIVGVFIAYPTPVKEVKKRFVATQRAKRLLATAFTLALILNGLLGAMVWQSAGELQAEQYLFQGTAGLFIFTLSPALLPLANVLMYPVEAALRRGFQEKARRRLRQANPIVIGITGSYGKTSTKVYLAHILGGRYKVLATPKSYNTLMGVCIVINNDLDPDFGYDYFITEMGAYIRGEIEEICALVHPQIGILIAIGPQHLERFGSLENIQIAKYELIKALPADGVGVFNHDDLLVRAAAEKGYPATRYQISTLASADDSARLVAQDIRLTPDGLRFTVIDRTTQESAVFNTRLIGRHNVTNILLASVVARHAGMSLNEIAMRVATLQPEEHRLTRTLLPNGITILDDAYNTNPIGAANALDMLALHDTGRRILITPGMVELGELQDQENENLGRLATESCTDIVLVGSKQTKPIERGVRSTAFPLEHLHIFETTKEAIVWYQRTVQRGDAVLFLNDLSDNYF
jgi:UDP-N-acetylmuramoyl-tripeptide--D-alanyl-D-alanine ligase